MRRCYAGGGNPVEPDIVAEVPVNGIVLIDGLVIHHLGFHKVQAVIVIVFTVPELAADDHKRRVKVLIGDCTFIDVDTLVGIGRVVPDYPSAAGFRVLEHIN